MEAYRTETVIQSDRVLTLHGVPFRSGERVEVIILSAHDQGDGKRGYPLRGQPISYTAPFASVDENEWEAGR